MIGFLLLYWIGKHHYTLAIKYDKNKWTYSILGVITYYAGMLIASFIIGIIAEIYSPGFLDSVNENIFSIFMIPFGLLTSYLLYKYLDKKWQKNILNPNPEPIDLIKEMK